MSTSPIVNAFTIDVEDYFQVSGFAERVRRNDWNSYEYRAGESTRRLLDLLARREIRGTFFVLGWVADRDPDLVRRIADAGHEVGCHSYWHRLLYDLDRDTFREDVRRSRDVLEQLSGRAVRSFRAPSFSVTRRSTWALEVLVEEGFEDDSSIFPAYHDRYGLPGTPVRPYIVETPSGPLREFPGSVRQIGPIGLPVSGGGYFRLLPGWLTHRCLRQINTRERRPFVFYLHPWEIDPAQPRMPGRLLARWRHSVNLATTSSKLDRLLANFRFGRMSDVLDDAEPGLEHLRLDDPTPTADVATARSPQEVFA